MYKSGGHGPIGKECRPDYEDQYRVKTGEVNNIKVFQSHLRKFIEVTPSHYINTDEMASFLGHLELGVIYGEQDLARLADKLEKV